MKVTINPSFSPSLSCNFRELLNLWIFKTCQTN